MPGYAVIGAGLLAVGIPLPLGFLLVGIVSHAILVGLVFSLASRLHSSFAGSVAAAIAVACPLLLDVYNPGMSQVPAATLVLLTWILVLRRGSSGTFAIAGLSAAAAWYLRAESSLMLPLWVAATLTVHIGAAERRSRWGRAGAFVGSYCLALVPWLVRSGLHAGGSPIRGNPMLLYTPEYPGYSSARSVGHHLPGMIEYVLAHPLGFAVRYVKDATGYVLDLINGLGPIAIGLLVAGLLIRELQQTRLTATEQGRTGVLSMSILILAIPWQIAFLSSLERSPRFLVPIVPIACCIIGIAVAEAVMRLRARALLLVLTVLLAERSATIVFQYADARRRFPILSQASTRELKYYSEPLGKTDLILSDVPDWVAWHSNRPALLFPLWSDLPKLLDRRRVSAIWLSRGAQGRSAADRDSGWVETLRRIGEVPGFRGPFMLSDGVRLYLPL